jgi:imidazolonepropionase-like amidohydrolase
MFVLMNRACSYRFTRSARAAALRTSVTAASLLGVERMTGTIDVGKEADIVAVPEDVLRNVAATETVRFVMKGGKVVRNER